MNFRSELSAKINYFQKIESPNKRNHFFQDIMNTLKQKYDFPESYCELGNNLARLDYPVEALSSYKELLRLKPNDPNTYFLIGKTLSRLGKLDESVKFYKIAINLAPNFYEIYLNLSKVLRRQKKFDEAFEYAKEALKLQPNNAYALDNIGNIYLDRREYSKAVQYFHKAAKLNPGIPLFYNDLGVAYVNIRNFDKAFFYFDKALEIKSDFVSARWNRALLLLLTGNFELGWKEYEWRWKTEDYKKSNRNYSMPRWNGTFEKDKTILVWAEQGMGDTIQFIRYIPIVKKYFKKVIVEVQEPLVKLISTCPGIDQVVTKSSEIEDFDMHIPLLSLPYVLYADFNSIPCEIPYLSVPEGHIIDNSRIEKVKNKLNIGIAWAGNSVHRNDHNRSCPVRYFIKLCESKNISLYSLQKGPQAHQLEPYKSNENVINLNDMLFDFSDTAAVVERLDLVATVDTALAHLAGSIGKPVWVLLPFTPDWRWGLDRSDSPWYPTMRLFRQSKPGDWEGVFKRIVDTLKRMPFKGFVPKDP